MPIEEEFNVAEKVVVPKKVMVQKKRVERLCINCDYYFSKTGGIMECRYYPPKEIGGYFPSVRIGCWCGHFESK